MIFLTTGTQLPFERLVRLVDGHCAQHPGLEVFGQIGDCRYRPRHFEHVPTLSLQDCHRRFEDADRVIAHAGIGSILTALGMAKPVLIMARRAAFGEHRNDHQVGTVERFAAFSHCFPFGDGEQLAAAMAAAATAAHSPEALPRHAPEAMLGEVRRLLA